MKIEVITYDGMGQRLATVNRVLDEFAARGVRPQLVHPSDESVRNLEYALSTRTLSTHSLRYTPVEAECIVLIDGDIIDRETVTRLEALDKDVYVIAPQAALPGGSYETLRAMLSHVELFPALGADDDYPRTFGCHHMAETCRNCEGLVVRWKATRRDNEARRVENLVPVDISTLGSVVAYTHNGQRSTSAYLGATKGVWAKFPNEELPATGMREFRAVMQATYEPVGLEPPVGLFACTCFVVANSRQQ